MKNKLSSVIIKNPGSKTLYYKIRDSVLFLITTYIWWVILLHLYLFFSGEGSLLNSFLHITMLLKLFFIGFLVSFLGFHFWATYNIRLHHIANFKDIQKIEYDKHTVQLPLQENYSFSSNLPDA